MCTCTSRFLRAFVCFRIITLSYINLAAVFTVSISHINCVFFLYCLLKLKWDSKNTQKARQTESAGPEVSALIDIISCMPLIWED